METGTYYFNRPWDRGGFLNSGHPSLNALAQAMKGARKDFRDDFAPEGGIPRGERESESYRVLQPLSPAQVQEVLDILRGQ